MRNIFILFFSLMIFLDNWKRSQFLRNDNKRLPEACMQSKRSNNNLVYSRWGTQPEATISETCSSVTTPTDVLLFQITITC